MTTDTQILLPTDKNMKLTLAKGPKGNSKFIELAKLEAKSGDYGAYWVGLSADERTQFRVTTTKSGHYKLQSRPLGADGKATGDYDLVVGRLTAMVSAKGNTLAHGCPMIGEGEWDNDSCYIVMEDKPRPPKGNGK